MDIGYRTQSRSVLDYGLIDYESADSVTSFVIDDKARFAAGSDHALLQCKIRFSKRPGVTWSFQEVLSYNIGENTNYTAFRDQLDVNISSLGLEQFSQLSASQMLPHISENINRSAHICFGLKKKQAVKKGRQLPQTVLQKIRRKKYLIQQLHESHNPDGPEFSAWATEANNLRISIR